MFNHAESCWKGTLVLMPSPFTHSESIKLVGKTFYKCINITLEYSEWINTYICNGI